MVLNPLQQAMFRNHSHPTAHLHTADQIIDPETGLPSTGDGESWEGTWSSGTYTEGQIVEHDDVVYQASATTTDEPPGVDWDILYTAPAAPAVNPLLYIDDMALDASGDEFGSGMGGWTTGGSPSASSTITTEPYDATCIDLTFPTQGDRYYKTIDSGDWTYYLTIHGVTNTTPDSPEALHGMLGLSVTDNAGTGTGLSAYYDGKTYLWILASHLYSSTGPIVTDAGANWPAGTAPTATAWPIVYKLAKSGTTITGGISFNGGATFKENTRTDSTTFTRINIVRLFTNGGTNPKLRVGRFNLVP